MRPTPLSYLMKQLSLTSKDWVSMGEKDKDDLKLWATEEMDALGL